MSLDLQVNNVTRQTKIQTSFNSEKKSPILPNEILLLIFRLLDFSSWRSVNLTCRHWYSLSLDKDIMTPLLSLPRIGKPMYVDIGKKHQLNQNIPSRIIKKNGMFLYNFDQYVFIYQPDKQESFHWHVEKAQPDSIKKKLNFQFSLEFKDIFLEFPMYYVTETNQEKKQWTIKSNTKEGVAKSIIHKTIDPDRMYIFQFTPNSSTLLRHQFNHTHAIMERHLHLYGNHVFEIRNEIKQKKLSQKYYKQSFLYIRQIDDHSLQEKGHFPMQEPASGKMQVDEQYIYIATEDQEAKVVAYDWHTKQFHAFFKGAGASIQKLLLYHNILVAGLSNGRLCLWNTENPDASPTLWGKVDDGSFQKMIEVDDILVVAKHTQQGNKIQLWDMKSRTFAYGCYLEGKPVAITASFQQGKAPYVAAVLNDGRLFLLSVPPSTASKHRESLLTHITHKLIPSSIFK